MTYTNEDKKIFVVRDLQVLIKEYGMGEVEHAFKYIRDYPSTKKVQFTDGFGNFWDMSEKQTYDITTAYANGNGKIQAIKLFRDITGCGLKEAKDAIEKYFDWKRPSNW